jgi:hypothetical protein
VAVAAVSMALLWCGCGNLELVLVSGVNTRIIPVAVLLPDLNSLAGFALNNYHRNIYGYTVIRSLEVLENYGDY